MFTANDGRDTHIDPSNNICLSIALWNSYCTGISARQNFEFMVPFQQNHVEVYISFSCDFFFKDIQTQT